ncbi:MAG: transcriptional coactivator/pterin dehydratase [Frankiales bacterium]|nr:transcriptional coactivator/pterin dehydratase [Frankiales bacterium]
MKPTILTADQLMAAESGLHPDWQVSAEAIRRTVEFPSFLVAVQFIDELAPVAEELDHHPDLTISWRTVGITLVTHSEGAVTEFDVNLAHRLDPIIEALLAPSD